MTDPLDRRAATAADAEAMAALRAAVAAEGRWIGAEAPVDEVGAGAASAPRCSTGSWSRPASGARTR
ncbi:hypothetical protein [Nocardia sp. NPDC057353]|uniref:hypothetical protein n=1 Tax=Nocardia sp. NPDC057353 TaxID=3346104 RepID=UPI00364127D3